MTEDLPTPPLPLATAYTRVRDPGWANGISFAGASPRNCLRSVGALLVGHHAERDLDVRHVRRPRDTAAVTSRISRSFIGQPATVSSTAHPHQPGRVGRDVLDHVQLGDRAPDLGVVDRRERGAEGRDIGGRHAVDGTERRAARSDRPGRTSRPPYNSRGDQPVRPARPAGAADRGLDELPARARRADPSARPGPRGADRAAVRLVRRARPARRSRPGAGCGWPSSPIG